MRAAVAVQLHAVELNRLRLAQRFVDRSDQCFAQPRPCHRVQIDVYFAGSGFKVFADTSADVDDVTIAIDQHCGWGESLLDKLIGQQLETFDLICRTNFFSCGHSRGIAVREFHFDRFQERVDAPVQACAGYDRDEQLALIANRFGAAEQQNTVSIQGIVKQGQELLLQLGAEVN